MVSEVVLRKTQIRERKRTNFPNISDNNTKDILSHFVFDTDAF